MKTNLEIGQTVVVGQFSNWERHLYTFARVIKITPTQVTLSNGKRYLIRSLREVGSGNYGTHIARSNNAYDFMGIDEANILNTEILQEETEKRMVRKLRDFRWKSLMSDDLKLVFDIVSKYDVRKENE